MHCSIWDTWTTHRSLKTREKRPGSPSWGGKNRRTIDIHSLLWIFIAVSAVSSILWPPVLGFCAAVLLASGGVVLGCRGMAVLAVFILSLSFFLFFRIEKRQVWLGLEDPELVEVRTLRDSRPAGQGSLHFLELIRIRDRRGNSAQARGEFIAWSRERLDLPWGAEIAMSSSVPLDTSALSALVVVEPLDTQLRISSAFRLRESLRQGMVNRLTLLPPQSSVLLEALLFGSKQRLLSSLNEGFRRIGCSHLLSLSGMHLAIIMTVGSGLLSLMLRRKLACFAVMLILPWYLFLIGPSPALLRAGILFSYTVLIPRSTRRIKTQDLLLQSFVFLLIANPSFLFDRGFQYSYAALAGMISLTPLFMPVLVRMVPYSLAAALSAGLSAYIGALPVSLLAYNTTNPVGIAATLVLTPLIWLYLSGGIIFFLVPGFSIVGKAAGIYFLGLYRAIQKVVELFSGISPAILPPLCALVLAIGAGLVISMRLIYSCLRFTMPEPADQEDYNG